LVSFAAHALSDFEHLKSLGPIQRLTKCSARPGFAMEPK